MWKGEGCPRWLGIQKVCWAQRTAGEQSLGVLRPVQVAAGLGRAWRAL